MSDWTELTETHGMTAGTPDAIDRLIDRYSESDSEPTGPKCVVCGGVCPSHDHGFVYDAGSKAYYIMEFTLVKSLSLFTTVAGRRLSAQMQSKQNYGKQ